MAGKKKLTSKEKALAVAEGIATGATLGTYDMVKGLSKVGLNKLKSRACSKKGGVFKDGKCIPKKEIRKGKSKSRDWYPEKVPGQVRNEMIERKIISQVKKGSRRKGRPV